MILFLMGLLAQFPPQPAKGSPEQRAVFERVEAEHRQRQRAGMIHAGLPDMDMLAKSGRVVRQVEYADSIATGTPSVLLERLADGRVALTVLNASHALPAVEIGDGDWQRLAMLEKDIFTPRRYVPWEPLRLDQIPPPPGICHGWTMVVAGTRDGGWNGRFASACYGQPGDPALAYAVAVAEIAVAAHPSCGSGTARGALWRYSDCFRAALRAPGR